MALALACMAIAFAHPLLFLSLPALLPIIGFAPWTGWISFEELDILVLAVAAGSYAGMARPTGLRHSGSTTPRSKMPRTAVFSSLLLGLFAISTIVAIDRGFSNAGGFNFGWYQGYLEPMNSVRLGKSFLEALLVLPLWLKAQRHNPEKAQRLLSYSLMLGLAGAALATVWERAAFIGLLNFSADYRTTGPFWEMHVGGAALDGFLTLTVPFALRELMVARTTGRWVVAAGVLALASYACLTTFSRGVYLAAPVGVVVLIVLYARQRRLSTQTSLPIDSDSPTPPTSGMALATSALVMAGFCAGAVRIFASSGYRGMATWLAVAGLMLPMASVMRGFSLKQWMVAWVLAAQLVLLTSAIAWLIPKGAYLGWALGAILTIGMLICLHNGGRKSNFLGSIAFAGFIASSVGAALVAGYWGESKGLRDAAPVLICALCVALVAGAKRKPLWPDSLRWQATTVAGMAAVAAIVAIFGGGAYMGGRFSTGEQDIENRMAHWKLAIDMVHSDADRLFGVGMGRFPANYFLAGDPQQHPGDFRIKQEPGNTFMTLTGGLHVLGWGEYLRVTQRVTEPGGHPMVTARVRTEKDVVLHFEVCEKHLLYNGSCLAVSAKVKGVSGIWQSINVKFVGRAPTRGDWFAPRLLAFSMAMETVGGVVDLDDIALTRADGRQLLTNGSFSDDGAHWFSSSDRNHLPWHTKNMFLNVLFEQGIIGAALWCLMVAGALWRTSFGRAASQPLAPALAAGLAGFFVVGLFDSLLDVPRLACIFYLLVLVALFLPDVAPLREKLGKQRSAVGLMLISAFCGMGMQPGKVWAADAEVARQVIRVGPTQPIKTIAQAASIARNGALIEVDAGEYEADVAVWTRDRLTIRAVGGRARLNAQGASAEGKAIWVVRAKGMRVEGFDFEGTKVPDRNGAGIRLEAGSLLVRDCRFLHNEMGLLTSNDPAVVLEVENSEFAYNQRPDGHNHNLYVGQIARLSVTGSYFHHARTGHLLKSRAALSQIVNNRLVDGTGGTASYELEFPNGGIAYVLGNTIAQSLQTENSQLISFGAEGYKWPRNEINLEYNTLINPLPRGGSFLRVAPGAVSIRAVNNRLVGNGVFESAGRGEFRNTTRKAYATTKTD
jgi:hypothetical protein